MVDVCFRVEHVGQMFSTKVTIDTLEILALISIWLESSRCMTPRSHRRWLLYGPTRRGATIAYKVSLLWISRWSGIVSPMH
jgi:hypothetical protein